MLHTASWGIMGSMTLYSFPNGSTGILEPTINNDMKTLTYTAKWTTESDWNGDAITVFRLFQGEDLIVSFNPAVDDEPVRVFQPVENDLYEPVHYDAQAEMIRRYNLQVDEAILAGYRLMKGETP